MQLPLIHSLENTCHYRIPSEGIWFLQQTCDGSISRGHIKGELSKNIWNLHEIWECQGCAFSLLLFNFAVDAIMRKVFANGCVNLTKDNSSMSSWMQVTSFLLIMKWKPSQQDTTQRSGTSQCGKNNDLLVIIYLDWLDWWLFSGHTAKRSKIRTIHV